MISDLKTGLYLGKEPWLAPADGWPIMLDAQIDKGVISTRPQYPEFGTWGGTGYAYPVVGLGKLMSGGYNDIIFCTSDSCFLLTAEGLGRCVKTTFTGGRYDYFWFQEYKGSLYYCNGIDNIIKHEALTLADYAPWYAYTDSWELHSEYDMSFKNYQVTTGTLKEYYDGYSTENEVYGARWWAQQFTAASSYTIGSVAIKVRRVNSPGTITVSIRAVDGSGFPTGADLCSGTYNGNTITQTAAGEWITFTMGAGAALTSGTKYTIVVRAPAGDAGDRIYWRSSNAYANAVSVLSYFSGAYVAGDSGDTKIQTCRMMFQYKNRLIFVSPKIGGIWYPDYIYYTGVNTEVVNATQCVRMIGNETPITGGYLLDIPTIFTREGGIWQITYTGNADAPFTWTRRGADLPVQARMGCTMFKDKLVVVGRDRIVSYDGTYLTNIDDNIRGFVYETDPARKTIQQIDTTKVMNTFAARCCDREWLLFVYTSTDSVDDAHDRILCYNFEEASWSIWDIPINYIFSFEGPWLDRDESMPYPPAAGDSVRKTLAGDAIGNLYQLNVMNDANPYSSGFDIRSCWFNPYKKDGLKIKLGWIKFLIEPGDGVGVSLFKDMATTAFKTVDLGPLPAGVNGPTWQIVYADGEVGDFFRVRITSNPTDIVEPKKIRLHGIIMGAKRAGRMGTIYQYTAPGLPG